jgi:hypothetical protein
MKLLKTAAFAGVVTVAGAALADKPGHRPPGTRGSGCITRAPGATPSAS